MDQDTEENHLLSIAMFSMLMVLVVNKLVLLLALLMLMLFWAVIMSNPIAKPWNKSCIYQQQCQNIKDWILLGLHRSYEQFFLFFTWFQWHVVQT
jgi:hypothetical protein